MTTLRLLLLLSLTSDIAAIDTMATTKDTSAYEQTKAAADSAYDEFESARRAFNERWDEKKENVEDASDSAYTAASEKVNEKIEEAKEVLHRAEDAHAADASLHDETKNNVGKAAEEVSSTTPSFLDEVKDAVHKAEEFVSDTVSSAYECTMNSLGAVGEGAKGAVHGLADSEPMKAAKHVVHQASEALSDMTK